LFVEGSMESTYITKAYTESAIKLKLQMKKLIIGAVLLTAAYTTQSCSASRSTAGPAGTVTPAYGSASNIASGRNVNGTSLPGGNPVTVPGPAINNSAVSTDSLSRQVGSAADKTVKFVQQATLNSYTEVESSKIALQKARNTYVKTFASTLMNDHTAADADLKSLAIAKNIPSDSLATNKDTDEKIKQLTAVTGEAFESIYIQMMIKDHEQAVSLYEQAEASDDEQVKAYAKKYLPMVKLHLKSISTLNKK
jgi:putative membrane protein